MSRKLKAEIEKVEQEIQGLEQVQERIKRGDTADTIASEIAVLERVHSRMLTALPDDSAPKPERKKRQPKASKPNGKAKEATV